jgi:hypothetical protein
MLQIVIPAKAGTHFSPRSALEIAGTWVPAFAGMTIEEEGAR